MGRSSYLTSVVVALRTLFGPNSFWEDSIWQEWQQARLKDGVIKSRILVTVNLQILVPEFYVLSGLQKFGTG